jgi:hypothetical protein
VPPAAVVGRHLFYNDSAFDGGNPGADAADDDAIAPDKRALVGDVPATSTFANFSSYSRGINGIMIDVRGLAAVVALGPEDFTFRAGNGGDPSAWPEAPAPLSITVRPGAGAAPASDRVTLIWPDGAIRNEWLQLTMKANDHTRLATADVFYFGNQIGETGDGPDGGDAVIDYWDLVLTRRAYSAGPTEISSPYDHNRDGRINLLDLLVVRRNLYQPPLQPLGAGASLPATPASAPPPGAIEDLLGCNPE